MQQKTEYTTQQIKFALFPALMNVRKAHEAMKVIDNFQKFFGVFTKSKLMLEITDNIEQKLEEAEFTIQNLSGGRLAFKADDEGMVIAVFGPSHMENVSYYPDVGALKTVTIYRFGQTDAEVFKSFVPTRDAVEWIQQHKDRANYPSLKFLKDEGFLTNSEAVSFYKFTIYATGKDTGRTFEDFQDIMKNYVRETSQNKTYPYRIDPGGGWDGHLNDQDSCFTVGVEYWSSSVESFAFELDGAHYEISVRQQARESSILPTHDPSYYFTYEVFLLTTATQDQEEFLQGLETFARQPKPEPVEPPTIPVVDAPAEAAEEIKQLEAKPLNPLQKRAREMQSLKFTDPPTPVDILPPQVEVSPFTVWKTDTVYDGTPGGKSVLKPSTNPGFYPNLQGSDVIPIRPTEEQLAHMVNGTTKKPWYIRFRDWYMSQ